MTAARPDVSAIVVTYNSRSHVDEAIRSILEAAACAELTVEIIIVDNASTDGTAEHVRDTHRDVILIQNESNVGFGRANNRGFERARGSAWLLLNPDARLTPPALGLLVKELRERRAGAVAPSIGSSGAESAGMAPSIGAAAGHFLFVNRILGDSSGEWRGIQIRRVKGPAAVPVDWASAAALLLDPASVRAVDGFDPRFFLYGEDIDLGVRLARAGHGTWLVPSATAEHSIAASQGGVSTRWLDALHGLYAETHDALRVAVFDLIMAVGLSIRAAVATVAGARVHARRMRAAARRAWILVVRPR